jgi:hypothetical protein
MEWAFAWLAPALTLLWRRMAAGRHERVLVAFRLWLTFTIWAGWVICGWASGGSWRGVAAGAVSQAVCYVAAWQVIRRGEAPGIFQLLFEFVSDALLPFTAWLTVTLILRDWPHPVAVGVLALACVISEFRYQSVHERQTAHVGLDEGLVTYRPLGDRLEETYLEWLKPAEREAARAIAHARAYRRKAREARAVGLGLTAGALAFLFAAYQRPGEGLEVLGPVAVLGYLLARPWRRREEELTADVLAMNQLRGRVSAEMFLGAIAAEGALTAPPWRWGGLDGYRTARLEARLRRVEELAAWQGAEIRPTVHDGFARNYK